MTKMKSGLLLILIATLISCGNWYNKGYDAAQKGKYKKAIKCFTKEIKSNPKDAESYNERGTAKDELELFNEVVVT